MEVLIMLILLTAAAGKTVDFTGRNLTHVPIDSLALYNNANAVMVVKLSDNRITNLGSFNTTPHILYLFIDNNRVKNLSPQTFQGLCDLRQLDLDRNYILSLRDFIFSDLAALLNLILSNNLISAISERAFHGLASLEFLELSGNRLSAFPEQAVRLIPSKQLLLVSLMVNSISKMPEDLKSTHPSTSYQLQGNPLSCPEKQVDREDMMNIADIDMWPVIAPYITSTDRKQNRTFVAQGFFIKSRYKYFGVVPPTIYVPIHYSVSLPLPINLNPNVDSFSWITPTGRRVVRNLTKAPEIEDFTAEDSGMYTSEVVSGGAKIYRTDMLLCLDWRPKEEQSTTIPPSDNFSPRGIQNNTDVCASSTNKSCCSYWFISKPSFHQKFCVTATSRTKLTVSLIISITIGIIVMILSPTALFCWRKRGTSRENNRPAAGATSNMGAQDMGVCSPRYIRPEVTEDPTEGESGPNAFPLRRLRSRESHWLSVKKGATNYNLHCVPGAPQADTIGTTEAQVHHYDNADASDADDEDQHHYDTAMPPPLPVYEETAAHAVTTDVLEVEGVSEQPAFQTENAGTGEEAMPYGIAAASLLYQRGAGLNNGALPSEHSKASSAASYSAPATESTQMQESLQSMAETNVLYQRAPAPNCRTVITDEHTNSAAADYCTADAHQTTETASNMTGIYHQTGHTYTDLARDASTTCHDDVQNLGILYGSVLGTAE